MMLLQVDPASHVPPFEQVRAQIEALCERGELEPGHRLPTVRRLADDLGLAVNTVARAYRELEQAGVVETRGRHGTFVAMRGADVEREGRVAAVAFARRARELGLGAEQALVLVREALLG
ncbi:GntR family transcriptional regulator [Cellulomonas sp. APG4]|uniref:GntR family transcriptional regulator n=1 Tax=Cellulomonas sp. APG4 TaxID=1538656 RepID=UPI001ED942EC